MKFRLNVVPGLNVGVADLIRSGKVKIKQGVEIARFTEIESIKHLSLADSEPLIARHMDHVWAVATEDFTAVVSTLYTSLDSGTVLKLLPKHGKSNSFPYVDSKNATAFIVDNPTQALTEKSNNAEKIMCHRCHIFIKPEDARCHVGAHIFKSINGPVCVNS
ncbi:hypothetical protein B0H13DRAFT_2355250 [Mycena leptocephala]|nr:hypothetical protein B0H13DRAFT_2355250 [Mycena leptocephala]